MDRPGGAAPEVCVAATSYAGPVRAALIAYKERGHRALARPLGQLLAAAAAEAATGVARRPLVLVPVPSAPAAVRARRFDHTLWLARAGARALRRYGVDARAVAALGMRRVPADSVGLSAAERSANIAGVFGPGARAGRLPARCAIVLVDDVVTTGATLNEAARTASEAGLPLIGAATVAATSRRRR
jgi:predicted amidophosphoribosyltransferase